MAYSFCLIRKFKEGDQQAIKNIITEATMEQVGNFFWGALLSELLPQIAVVFIAVSYILIGIPLKYCLLAIPLSIVLLYMSVWIGHWIKANELTNDLDCIPSHYMTDPYTSFYVAEFYGKAGEAELASLMNRVKKVEYDFYTEKEFQVKNLNLCGLSKIIVGSIAITRSLHHMDRAWFRRMAVKVEYRRRRIAYHLLKAALIFCEGRKFVGVELITTECHNAAKQMYANEGFKEVEVSQKSFFGVGASQVLYHMYRPLHEDTIVDNIEESLMESQES